MNTLNQLNQLNALNIAFQQAEEGYQIEIDRLTRRDGEISAELAVLRDRLTHEKSISEELGHVQASLSSELQEANLNLEEARAELIRRTQEAKEIDRRYAGRIAALQFELDEQSQTRVHLEQHFVERLATAKSERDGEIARLQAKLETSINDFAKRLREYELLSIERAREATQLERAHAATFSSLRGSLEEQLRARVEREELFSAKLANLAEERERLAVSIVQHEAKERELESKLDASISERCELVNARDELRACLAREQSTVLELTEQARAEKAMLEAALREVQDELVRVTSTFAYRVLETFRRFFGKEEKSVLKRETHDGDAVLTKATASAVVQTPAPNVEIASAGDNLHRENPFLTVVPRSEHGIMLSKSRTEDTQAASTLEELLAYDDAAFVYCAYLTLLKRMPDEEGLRYYTARLRSGISKMQIVVQLVSSSEMLPSSTTLPGLKNAVSRWKRRRLPVVGRLFLPPDVGRSTSLERKLISVQNSLAFLAQDTAARFEKIDARLTNIQHAIQQVGDATQLLERAIPTGPTATKNVLGKSGHRYVFNLTTSHHWRAPVVGIIRVERELAKYLQAFDNVSFVLWDSTSKALRLLGRSQVNAVLSEQWCDSQDSSVSKYDPQSLPGFEITASDTFISIGLDWDLTPTQEIAQYLKPSRARVVCACYDIVPILFPEFTVREGMGQMFKRHFVEMAHAATEVFTISEASRSDLLKFWTDAEVDTILPKLSVVPLASDPPHDPLPVLGEKEVDMLRHVLASGRYVLYVSSLEARKNHRLLVNVWRELYREMGDACPQLIFVGMKGWGVDDLLQQIGRTPAFLANKIVWLNGVSDGLLAHLYANCLFTVFPSIYEGWGLAATEAMAYGKVCVGADNSALPESTQELMPLLHPSDFFGWKEEISSLINDDGYRSKLERKIAENYRFRSWRDFSDDFCQKLLVAA
ncbi:glycosyltransferase [Paraburkholderia atlantica]|uniref:glycosyltransferase n=1 Tax=Paraburkholderia atlantica TaxID=2654982 RepID=UPI000365AEEB|nr:glycosyltransferase [Paraburkholderia atlantica]